jgi:hypothetical protein
MGPKTRASIWVALAIVLYSAPMLVLGFIRPAPLWLHVALVVVLSVPGIVAMAAAWTNYNRR